MRLSQDFLPPKQEVVSDQVDAGSVEPQEYEGETLELRARRYQREMLSIMENLGPALNVIFGPRDITFFLEP